MKSAYKGAKKKLVLLFTGIIIATSAVTVTAQSTPVTAESIEEYKRNCENAEPGTVGEAINDAIKVHVKLSELPNVEDFFDADCFAGITTLYDMSGAIPSVGGMVSQAQGVLENFLKKQVCSVVQKVTEIAAAPINKAIKEINMQFEGLAGMKMPDNLLQDALDGKGRSLSSPRRFTTEYVAVDNPIILEEHSFNFTDPKANTTQSSSSRNQPNTPQERGSRFQGLSNVFN